jgi:hypothetical protein
MRFDVLYNFISPVTGQILCTQDYVLVGNRLGVATPSPILIDIRLDIINIRKNFNQLTITSFIVGSSNDLLPNAQALDTLANGFMINTGGIISTIATIQANSLALTHNKLFIGDVTNTAIETQTILIDNLPNLAENHLWSGDQGNKPVEITTIKMLNLPNLANGKIWKGNGSNRAVEVSANFAPDDAFYVIKQPNSILTNAQSLDQLVGTTPRILKAALDGTIEVAIPDTDYATVGTLEQIRDQTEQFKNQAASSANSAASSATNASNSATASGLSATEATAAAATATSAASAAAGSALVAALSAAGAGLSAIAASASESSASSSADDASNSASNAASSAAASAVSAASSLSALNTILTTGITLQGDILGSGIFSAPIITTFKENPVFLGHESITIPFGNTAERPLNPTVGMIRFNIEI